MSMVLRCIYEEDFTSVLNKVFKYRDELNLERVRDPDSWIVKCWNYDGTQSWFDEYKHKKTNQEIYEHYLVYIKKEFPEKCNKIIKTYSYEDTICTFQGVDEETLTPIKIQTWFDIHKENCDEFFNKYGIDNIEWMVL